MKGVLLDLNLYVQNLRNNNIKARHNHKNILMFTKKEE